MEAEDLIRRPIIPADCQHNAHMYYVLLAPDNDRVAVLASLERNGINAVFHYVPLHSSPAGKRYGRAHGSMAITDMQSARLIRLPLWVGLTEESQHRVTNALRQAVIEQRD
jgi:dTDP-4-amino-4,6-dideoxygalactose transaminase